MWKPVSSFYCLLQSTLTHQDLNTKVAWAQGYTGKGIVVTILDDGIEKDHPDLINNYVSEENLSLLKYCTSKSILSIITLVPGLVGP